MFNDEYIGVADGFFVWVLQDPAPNKAYVRMIVHM